MGFKIREGSSKIKRRKTKERKVVEKFSYNQLSSLQQRQCEFAEENIGSIQTLQRQSQHQHQNRRRRNERSPKQQEFQIPLQVNSHTLIGSITYGDKDDCENSKAINSHLTNEELNKPIEQQVLEYYQEKIDKLDVRQTLKSYLRRTLDTIILTNDSDKIFLLEIRKQLKQSQRIAAKQEYSDFLQLVDNLYLLAVDKYLTQKLSGPISPRNNTSPNSSFLQNQQSPTSSYAPGLIGEQNANSPTLTDSILRLQTTNSTEIVRILQRNALQRLAQAYRRVAANNSNNISRLSNNSIVSHNNSFSNSLRENYLSFQQQERSTVQVSNSSIGSNSRRTNNIGSQSTYEDIQFGSSLHINSNRIHNENVDIPTLNNNNSAVQNPLINNNVNGQEDYDDLFYLMRNPLDQNTQGGIHSSSSNSSLLSFGRGRYIGVRSISNQVTANQGDTSVQTSSETGSNISN